jgi:hypothetical protein
MPQLTHNQQEAFKSLSVNFEGRELVEYLKALISECESAKGKKSWEEVQGGLIAGKLIQSEVIDKLESLSGNQNTKEVDEGEYT